jgi:acyl-CoA dehydrogenase
MRRLTGMDFNLSAKTTEYAAKLQGFMDSEVFPAEGLYEHQRAQLAASGKPHGVPAVVEELKVKARALGLWNLFLPHSTDPHHGLSVVEYATLAEITGWSPDLAPEAINCAAPDTGNMELLDMFGTPEQKKMWLEPLLDGRVRSGFAMTEPDVASSDARNIRTSIVRDGDHYVINGIKWWTTGAMDERCAVLIVMGKTNPDAADHQQQSMVLVPIDTPGVTVERNLKVFGYVDQHGHAQVSFKDVRVPVTNLVGAEGEGFALAQARLGPGRIHHCMRAIGMAERALSLMIKRSMERETFGVALVKQGVVQDWIATARIEIEQARLLVLKAAWMIDTVGAKGARKEIAAIKVAVPQMAQRVIDNAIQSYGGAGVCQDTPLAAMYAGIRTLRIVDGPDEVHIRDIARLEIKPYLA